MRHGRRIAFIAALALAGATTVWYARTIRPVIREPTAPPPAWATAGPFQVAALDHLFDRFVRDDGTVDYAAWAADSAARRELESFLAAVAAASPRSRPELFPDRTHRIAYWIRAWHACGIAIVLDHWPMRSLLDVPAPLAVAEAQGFFRRIAFRFGGEPMTLKGLLVDWLIPEADDPRIVFAIGGFAAPFGPLPRRVPTGAAQSAYLAARTDAALAGSAFSICDRNSRVVRIPTVAAWYRDQILRHAPDGPSDHERLLRLLASLMPRERAQELSRAVDERWSISPVPVDWTLR